MPGAPPGTASGEYASDELERRAIERARRGDVAAFNMLVTRYQSMAYGLALRMLGDPEAAADVTQDAFFSAYRNLESYRGSSFRSWLLRIVSNGCYDFWRAQRRRPATSLEALREGAGEGTDEGPGDAALGEGGADMTWDPDRVSLRRETIAAIEAALLQLPAEQRLAIVLSDIQGLDYEEVARVTAAPLGTVKSRIARARDRLRRLLTPRGELSQGVERPPDRDARADTRAPGREEKA
ncbi:MAG TPA: sigma-70 family RNA polymerase sigma factor [Ktedonobacterales bacterium]